MNIHVRSSIYQINNEKQQIINEIEKVEKAVQSYQGNLKGVESKGWDSLLFDLQEFKKGVNSSTSYFDVAQSYFEKLFWRKSKNLALKFWIS